MADNALAQKDKQTNCSHWQTLTKPYTIANLVLMSALSVALFACDGSNTAIQVSPLGRGSIQGSVDHTLVIDCGTVCSHQSDESFTVKLRATEKPGAEFRYWTGDANVLSTCGSTPECTVTVPKFETFNVTAIFVH